MKTVWYKKLAKIIVGIILFITGLSLLGYAVAPATSEPTWGINYSPKYAEGLGFDSAELFQTILDDLQVKHVRLPVYWDDFEPVQNSYNTEEIDELLDIAEQRDVQIILAIGRKLPRWPECHEPVWLKTLTAEQQEQALLSQVETAVRSFESRTNIAAWQLENEAFFDYGDKCPVSSKELYKKELAVIRETDTQKRPIIGTDSGEKGAWLPTAWTGIDIFGSTMYRQVYLDKEQRYTTYPLPAWTYRVKAGWVKMFSGADRTFGVELQAEPWFAGTGPVQTQLSEHLRLMNRDILQENIDYAKASGLEQHYFWGAEWWYWMAKTHNEQSLIETVRPLFQ